MSPLKRHLLLGSLTGLCAAALGLLPPSELLELKGYDLLHAFRKPSRPAAEIVIVAIDEPSFAEFGQQWPWPRSLHGRLVETLAREGAAVVAFDVLFAEPSTAAEDEALAGAIRSAGNVVLASHVEVLSDRNYAAEMAVEPIERFREGASTGIATVPVDRDGVVRRYQPLDRREVSFAAEIGRLYTGKALRAPEGAHIAYLGPPGSFAAVSYYQAADPGRYLPHAFFRGKIVLIGRNLKTSPEPGHSGPDLFATPFLAARKSRLMAGVEIHANMVHGLLEGRFVARLSRARAAILFFALGLLGSLLQAKWRPLRSGVLAGLALAGYWAGAYALVEAHGLWVPTLLPVLCFVVPYGSSGLNAYLQSERKRRQIRKAFGHYLSPEVLKVILENPEGLRLGGEKVEATILFSDIVNFTTLAERLSPEGVGSFLNRYFTEMTKIVFDCKGTIDKFMGDAVMAFWGAPVPDGEHALGACRAAAAMQERMRSLREEMKRDGLPELFVRIGIHTGEVIVGNMGSSELFNYTVLGDAVNLASRLEGANKDFGTSILISRSVYDRAASALQARPLGKITVKGKTTEVEVFELLGVAQPQA
ncbi:MAG: adenylate/guanylate cyclase domain-containing protein [bacterium]